MADYYPLIARAVAGLEKNSGENRRALYERARAALLAQLRGLPPALDKSDITRERLALEESIRKVEAESARKFADTTRAPAVPKVRAGEPQPPEHAAGPPPPPCATPPGPHDAGPKRPRGPQPPLPSAAKQAPPARAVPASAPAVAK